MRRVAEEEKPSPAEWVAPRRRWHGRVPMSRMMNDVVVLAAAGTAEGETRDNERKGGDAPARRAWKV